MVKLLLDYKMGVAFGLVGNEVGDGALRVRLGLDSTVLLVGWEN